MVVAPQDRRRPHGDSIETSVRQLLTLARELLQCLTEWANQRATDNDVSSVYVELGNTFNQVCRQLLARNVDVADLGNVPLELRMVLEPALSEQASTGVLEKHLPSIQTIIVSLVRRMREKQAILADRNREMLSSRTPSHSRGASHKIGSGVRVQTSPDGPMATTTPSPTPKRSSGRKQSPIADQQAFAALQGISLERRASKRYSQYHMTVKAPGETIYLPTASPHASSHADYTDLKVVKESRMVPRLAALPEAGPPRSFSASRVHGRRVSNGRRDELKGPQERRVHESNHTEPKKSRQEEVDEPLQEQEEVPETPGQAQMQTPETQMQTPQELTKGSLKTALETALETARNPQPATPVPEVLHGLSVDSTLTVFLKLGRQIRKGTLKYPPSLAALRLQFVDIFGYTITGNEVFPDMVLHHMATGIEYQLTEATLGDLEEASLVTLCVKTEEERSMEHQLQDLGDSVAKILARLELAPAATSTRQSPHVAHGSKFSHSGTHHKNGHRPHHQGQAPQPQPTPRLPPTAVDEFRKEIAVIRQISSKTVASLTAEAHEIRTRIKELRATKMGSGREYMMASYNKLDEDCTRLVEVVDDLQDLVEDQRKDVASRGVRLSRKQLDNLNKQLDAATKDVRDLAAYIAKEQPSWNRTWETELNTIVEERQFFKHQHELVNDMLLDLEKAHQTFALVEECTEQLTRSDIKRQPAPPPPLPVDGVVQARNAVLGEVSALRPNHEKRVEAIERAERLRKRELQMRAGEFEEELGEFVGESRLKQSGGVEEAERRRKERDELLRKQQAEFDALSLEEKERVKEERRKARAEAKKETKEATEGEEKGDEENV